jgi:hypothetical protein
MALVREGDVSALAYLNALPDERQVAKMRAGSVPWRPVLIVTKDWQDQPRDADGRWGSGGGEERPTFPGSVFEPVQQIANGRDAYVAAHPELGAPGRTDIDYSKVAADPATGKQIADLYDKAPNYDPAAQPAYDALKAETAQQYDYLTKTLGITVEVADHDPYKNVSELVRDLQENHHQYTLSTAATGGKLVIPETGKPIFTNEENDKFRAVHDAFGHAATGRAFDRNGEAAAWASHMQMFSPLAGRAVSTETHARNSVLIYGRPDQKTGPAFAAQKVFLLPERLSDVNDVIPGRTGKALDRVSQAAADADNLYDETHCHHTSQGRYLPGAKKGLSSFFRGGAEVEQERDEQGRFGSGGDSKPEEGGTKGWAPHMTAEEATKWQQENGAGKPLGSLFHGTEAWRADKITEGGFKTTGPASNAQMYGQGAYLTTSETLGFWKYAQGEKNGLLETRVALTNPASFKESAEVFAKVKEQNPGARDYPRLVREEAQRRGFDALTVQYHEPVMGPSAPAATHYVVFDPQKITVIDRDRSSYRPPLPH